MAQSGETSASSWGSLMLPLPLERGASAPQSPLLGRTPGMPPCLGKEPHGHLQEGLSSQGCGSCWSDDNNGHDLQSTDRCNSETLISKESNFSIYMLKHASTSRENSCTLHCLESLHNSPPTVCCQSIFILNSIYTGIYYIYTNTFFSC